MGILKELLEEVKRLMTAGSSLAQGDFGLKKLMPQLKRMSENSPVFARISKMVEELVVNIDNSEERLLELASLIIAILYTQGEWEIKGGIEEIELIKFEGTTCLGCRKLSPVIQAMTSKGGGRYNIIVEAYEQGVFQKKDKRLIEPILQGINDSYNETSNFIIDNILPIYGEEIGCIIKERFDIKGSRNDGKMLKAIYRLYGSKEMNLYKQVLDQGSLQVKMAAMEILDAEMEPNEIFEELAKDKHSQVRDMAKRILDYRKRGIVTKLFWYYYIPSKS